MLSNMDINTTLKVLNDLAPAGFAIAFHVEFAAPSFLLQNYPKDWQAIYNRQGLMLKDPTVRWSSQNNGLIRWSALADDDPDNVFGQAAEHGLKFGAACGLESMGTRTLAGFARSDREPTAGEMGEFERLLYILHDASSVDAPDAASIRENLKKLSAIVA